MRSGCLPEVVVTLAAAALAFLAGERLVRFRPGSTK